MVGQATEWLENLKDYLSSAAFRTDIYDKGLMEVLAAKDLTVFLKTVFDSKLDNLKGTTLE